MRQRWWSLVKEMLLFGRYCAISHSCLLCSSLTALAAVVLAEASSARVIQGRQPPDMIFQFSFCTAASSSVPSNSSAIRHQQWVRWRRNGLFCSLWQRLAGWWRHRLRAANAAHDRDACCTRNEFGEMRTESLALCMKIEAADRCVRPDGDRPPDAGRGPLLHGTVGALANAETSYVRERIDNFARHRATPVTGYWVTVTGRRKFMSVLASRTK
jgi:hypothetical protein